MSNEVFPYLVRGMDVKITKTPTNSTIVQSSPSGYSTRIAQMNNPMWRWKFVYNYLKDRPVDIVPGLSYTDLQTLQGFYLARQGQFDSFLYSDPYDNFVGPGLLPGGGANPQAQLQLIQDSDSGEWYSPIQIYRGGQFFEDITDLQGAGTFYANGVIKRLGVDYTIVGPGLAINGHSFYGLVLHWSITPTALISGQFNFYYRVRFETDEQDFDQWLADVWAIGGPEAQNSSFLEIVTARPPSS